MIDNSTIWRYDLAHLTSIWHMGNPIHALIDSFHQKMTDVLVADHNRSINVITGEPQEKYIPYLQVKLLWAYKKV